MLVCFSAGTQFRHNFALTLCRFYAYFAPFRQADFFFNNRHFLFWQPPIGENFARSAAGNLSYIASSASGNRIGYAKGFRDKGRGATTGDRPQDVPRFASGRSADRTATMQKTAPATARYFRLCTALRRAT